MKGLILTATALLCALTGMAQNTPDTEQNCRCEESFEWLRSTFEANDAGFGYIVERKGRAAYDLHNQMTLEKARTVQNWTECRSLLAEWLTFFRSAHIRIELLIPDTSASAAQSTERSTQPDARSGDNPPADPAMESYIRSRNAREPYLEQINPTTLYMRIPSFDDRHKAAIERMIADNFDTITSTENLIIDVRGNGGGSDVCYEGLLPLIYTNPVRTPNVSFLAAPHTIEQYSAIAQMEDLDEEVRRHISTVVERMKSHPGEFVPMLDEDIQIETREVVYQFPRNVGIIVDRGCASTTEQFLLAAKQSRKVKLFGVTTRGALDASNLLAVESPDGRFRLTYATSLSSRIPGMAIDDIGLQPDYYLDKSIPSHKWVEFVNDVLNR